MSSLQLNDDVEGTHYSDDEEESEVEGSDSEITKAFREDESRKNVSLTPENAARVMEAMRGIPLPEWLRIGRIGSLKTTGSTDFADSGRVRHC
ncbi:hypothetical protein M0R45_007815 [Rubus argutus]|uniref:Uncharacterized protein n=1 Tax=Rubus argutus TaxID=59490 RepID=A0AAW1XZT1_RUBAR